MDSYQTPPTSEDRLAIVVIHGIGNQQPLDTLLPFASNLIEAPAQPGEPKFWSKPDKLSESLELRRLTARKSATRPTTDFYEYYWAHKMPDATYKQVLSWARRLVFVNPRRLLPKIRIYCYLSWFIMALALALFCASFFFWDENTTLPFTGIEVSKGLLGLLSALALPVLTSLLEHILLKYVGDAARYLQPDPENIEVRQEIRANGIQLLRDLHAADKDGKQRYSRIVVVGHSLGSVIAYDILKHLWDDHNGDMECPPDSLLHPLESLAVELQNDPPLDLLAKPASVLDETQRARRAAFEKQRSDFRRLQRFFWLERYEAARAAGKPAWLVSDLITLGSPLVHADVLLDTHFSTVQDRQDFRELPTCPPVMEKRDEALRFSYKKWNTHRRPTKNYLPHHAAVFSATVWTNMFFPGDIVGDRLAPVFGPGIEDIPLSLPASIFKGDGSPASHTLYWTEVKGSTNHLSELRDLLGFNEPVNQKNQPIVVKFTKRQAMLGRQCEKAIWLDHHQPERKTPFTKTDLFRFEQGNAVDKAAQQHYSGGIEVADKDWALALFRTGQLIDEGKARLYQAAFEHNDLRIRTDVLDLLADRRCRLREVKMSTSKKDEHVLDIAIQVHVLEACGLPVEEAFLVHVNREYVAGGELPLFIEVDVTREARALAAAFDGQLDTFKSVIDQEAAPDILIGAQCTKPWDCAFKDHCWKDVPADSIFTIPRLHHTKREMLIKDGILGVKDVPDDFELTAKQAAYVSAQKSGEDKTDRQAIKQSLEALQYPIYFLDFETYSTPLPAWTGVQTNQQVPVQFSCHKLEENGELSHADFLHTVFEDPRRLVAEALKQHIGPAGSILVYSQSFEEKILRGLAAYLPEYRDHLEGMIERLFDQLVLVKQHVHHPGLLGSNSLKTVSDVLLDRIDYKALDIGDGALAQAQWYNMTQLPAGERDPIAQELKKYCYLDTLAQVELHRWFLSKG